MIEVGGGWYEATTATRQSPKLEVVNKIDQVKLSPPLHLSSYKCVTLSGINILKRKFA